MDTRRATAGARLDSVFLASGDRIPGRTVASRVVLDEPRGPGRVRWPSDHYGVLADVSPERGDTNRMASGGPQGGRPTAP